MMKKSFVSFTEYRFYNREEAENFAKVNHGYFSKSYDNFYIVTIYHWLSSPVLFQSNTGF